MIEPTKEQIRELWGKCGLKEGTYGWMYDPAKPFNPIMPPIDLNNLFKYAIPKVREILGADELSKRLQGWLNDVIQCGLDPAESLFWVVWVALGGNKGRWLKKQNN